MMSLLLLKRVQYQSRTILPYAARVFTTQAEHKVNPTISSEELQRQKEQFEELRKQLFIINQQKTLAKGKRPSSAQLREAREQKLQEEGSSAAEVAEETKSEIELLPNRLSDIKKVDIIMQCDRTLVDFKNEIRSLYIHEQTFQRPRLSQLVNNVYIPKFKAKSLAAYLYGGESFETHSDYKTVLNEPNTLFDNLDRSRDEVILGIESSFDESAASLINSFGEIKANHQISQWDQWEQHNGIMPDVSKERHIENIPVVVEKALNEYSITKGDKRLRAIAVTMGPGLEACLNVGLRFAQDLGKQYGVPVIPVNHVEGHVMTSRFNQVQPDAKKDTTAPLLKFPYVTLIVTGKHTEIVLNRGVGLHTILGMTIDSAVGECFDKAFNQFKRHQSVLQNKENQQEFIDRYNRQAASRGEEPIPSDYFNFLNSDTPMANGRYIELLARYGDPSEIDIPIGLHADQNADMSYTGVKTKIQALFHFEVEDLSIPIYERQFKNLNFTQLTNYAASIQFGCFEQIRQKLNTALIWCKNQGIQLNALNLAGGVSCNGELRRIMTNMASQHELRVTYSSPSLCTDNGAMIAWMGWELINAQQDVDISDVTVNALKRIPLGSYVEGLVNVKQEVPGFNRVMVKRHFDQKVTKLRNQKKLPKDFPGWS